MPQPKIGLSMLYMLSEPFGEMVKELENVQTKYIEIVDDGYQTLNMKRVAILKSVAKKHDLHYSVHAPFADINPASPSKQMLSASMRRLKQSLNYAHALDAYLWIFHPGSKSGISSFYPMQDWKQNLASISELNAMAKNLSINVAMENLPEKYNFLMKKPEDFERFYDETGLDDIGIVLDTGHANLEGQTQHFLQKLPNKIVHIHISDNHGDIDEHLGLGYGEIDWQYFIKTLKATDFSGTVLTESVFNVQETLQKLQALFA